MFSVGDGIANQVFQEYLELSTYFLVNEAGKTHDSSTAG
jgi:hypothetical protein